ncbi:pentapeptide repeat-containing protein [uncultured Roseobacter sp.]|uniref:pentapeptide repeat-containing protein n=1 Tax=uncultured Roseobacter sp. TaxID=114847 RepID=UPI00260DA52A|nr:pentapeptide repeat-containing protein [uncultured Roseobacter sp.]
MTNKTVSAHKSKDNKPFPEKLGRETLASSASIVLFGRLVDDLSVVKTHDGKREEDIDQNQPARIYGATYDGVYIDMVTPVLFMVDAEKSYDPKTVPVPGPSTKNHAFYNDLSAWVVQRTDKTVRLDVDEGKFEDLLLELGGEDLTGISGARVSGARVSGARVSGARVSGARVSGARVSGARISGARGDASD